MRTKRDFAQEIFKIIKEDARIAFTFFSKLKDEDEIEIFVDLVRIGVFSEDQLPKIERTTNGYTQPLWAQAIYLQYVAGYIRTNKLGKSDPIVTSLLTVLRNLRGNKENSTVVSAVFKAFACLPASVITCRDIGDFFEYVSYEKGRDIILEYAVHEGFQSFLETITDNNHERACFRCWIKEYFGKCTEKRSHGGRDDLMFFDDYKLKQFYKKHFVLDEIKKKGRTFLIYDALEAFDQLLNNRLSRKGVDESSVYWRPAVEDHAQNRFHHSAPSVYVEALYKLINFLSENEGKQINTLSSFRDSAYKTKNRLYIAVTSKNPSLYSVMECANKIIEYGLSHHIRHEAYHFFNMYFSVLDIEVQDKILDAIEALNEDDHVKSNEERVLHSSWKKIRWLQAIKYSGNKRATKLYEDCCQITGNEAEHPDFSSYVGGGWVGPKSPWEKDEFAKASPNEILDILKTFECVDEFRGPTKEGLARTLEDFISEDPIKLSILIDELNQLEPIYISSIYDGYAKAWKEKKHVPVGKLLIKFSEMLKCENFYKKFSIKDSRALWTVNSVLKFIEAGVRDDSHAFEEGLNDLCYEIVRELALKVKPTGDYVTPADAYTRAINEPRGILFETAILLALRKARLAADKDGIARAWSDLYVLIKEPLESKSLEEISLHALIGAYYRQFLYLDNSWILDNIDLVAPIEAGFEPLWVAFMEGFGYVSAFVVDMYNKLNQQGILLKFLRYEPEAERKDNRVDRLQGRIVELCLIAYLLCVEELDSGLMGEILAAREPMEWKKLIGSIVPVLGSNPKAEHIERVGLLMKKLFELYEATPAKEELSEHFIGVSSLLDVINDIEDENAKSVLKISATNSEGFWDLTDVIEFLHKFKDGHSKLVGLLLVEVLNSTRWAPTYPEEKLREILDSVKLSGDTVTYARLCRIYKDRSPDFKI